MHNTDATTTLYWIEGKPYRWKTWVANRVSAIQEIEKELRMTWHHCPGEENPARPGK